MVQWGGSCGFAAKEVRCDFVARTFVLIAPVQPVLHQVSCSNETIQNAPKNYETQQYVSLGNQWSGSGAFVAKNSKMTSWHKLVY